MKFKIITAVFISLASLSFCARSEASPINVLIQALSTVNSDKKCNLPKSQKPYFSNWSCSELLENETPSWIKSIKDPGVFADNGNWFGLCDQPILKNIRNEMPEASRQKQVEILSDLKKSLDACAPTDDPSQKERKDKTFKPPTQREL